MKDEIKRELLTHIIPFWDKLLDKENGGFCGYAGHDLIVNRGAFKGAILHSRILWFYSSCYLMFRDDEYLAKARHCYDFMVKHFLDRESGGLFWSVNVKGVPVNPMKHGYCNAFFIYALASFYEATRDSAALNNAMRMFEIVETRLVDTIGYRESCDRDWNTIENDELSENGIKADKTMNTILHLIEAYTELFRVSNNGDVLSRLEFLLKLTYVKIYDPSRQRLSVFFDRDMNPIGDVHSYGHDIEAAWLIGRAIDVAGDSFPPELNQKIREMNQALVEKVDEVAFCESGAMYYESVDGFVNKTRTWWVQAEAFVGFLDAYRLSGKQRYLDRATGLWEYIKAYMIDRRQGGEWYNELTKDHIPKELPVADEWKCPYHNGRMCLEALTRL
jgi:mannobiose 2-epimerase